MSEQAKSTTLIMLCSLNMNWSNAATHAAIVMTCASESGSRMRQNPTGDDRVSSAHEHGSRAKVASSTTALAHRFPPPSSSGC